MGRDQLRPYTLGPTTHKPSDEFEKKAKKPEKIAKYFFGSVINMSRRRHELSTISINFSLTIILFPPFGISDRAVIYIEYFA
jgi:hypothetical protein